MGVLVALAVLGAPTDAASGTYFSWNLLHNGGLEMGLEGWQASGAARLQLSQSQPYSGFQSVEISGLGAGDSGLQQDISEVLAVQGPGHYRLDCAVNIPNATQDLPIVLAVLLSDRNGTRQVHAEVFCNQQWHYRQGDLDLDWVGDLDAAVLSVTCPPDASSVLIDELWLRKAQDLSNYRFDYPTAFPMTHSFRNKGEAPSKLIQYDIVHDMGGYGGLKDVRQLDARKTIVGQASWGFAGGKGNSKGLIWPGYFLYAEGIKLTGDLNTSSTTIHIADAGKIAESQDGPNPYFDIAIIRIKSDGKPDWYYVEKCKVTATQPSQGTITVERAYQSTTAKSFKAQQAYVAQHHSWLGGSNPWMYNFAFEAPRHPVTGMNGAEYYAYKDRNYFQEHPHLDGVQYDVAKSDQNRYGLIADADNDRVPDWGWFNGVNSYGLGAIVAMQKKRAYYGPDKLFNVDGEGPQWVRAWDYVDGYQFEACIEGENRFGQHYDFLLNCVEHLQRPIRYSYCYNTAGDGNGHSHSNMMRLSLAASCLLGIPYAHNPDRTNTLTPQDEYWGGALQQPGWLGEAVTPTRAFYAFKSSQNLLRNRTWTVGHKSGYTYSSSNIPGGKVIDVRSIPQNKAPDFFGVTYETHHYASSLQKNTYYTLIFEARGDDIWTYDGETFQSPRALEFYGLAMVANANNKSKRSGYLVSDNWRQYVVSYRTENSPANNKLQIGVGEQIGSTAIRNVQLYQGSANRYLREFENGYVVCNASPQAWTVTLETPCRRIKGSITPSVNNGSYVGSHVTVPAWDALFLIKSQVEEPPEVETDLPSPWLNQDIGSVGAAGSASYFDGTFTVAGSGKDIWEQADAFHFVYQPLNGDGEIIARVMSQANTHAWAKAGIMVRSSLAPDAAFAVIVMTPRKGASFQWRKNDGASADQTTKSASTPQWLKLTRSANTFTGYISDNGESWTAVSSQTVNLGAAVQGGLCVTSHNDGILSEAVFTDVMVSTAVTPPTRR